MSSSYVFILNIQDTIWRPWSAKVNRRAKSDSVMSGKELRFVRPYRSDIDNLIDENNSINTKTSVKVLETFSSENDQDV